MTMQELIVRGQREVLGLGELQDLALRASKEGFRLPHADEALGVLRRHADVALESSKALVARAQREKRELLASEQRTVDQAHTDAKAINQLIGMVAAAKAEHAYSGAPTERSTGRDGHPEARGFLPSATEYRAMGSSGLDTLGGYLVPEQQSAMFWDRLRAQSIMLGLPGINIVEMSGLEVNVPGLSASATATMVAENAEISTSDLTLTRIKLTARKCAAIVPCSNEWLNDAQPSARQIVEQDLVSTLALKLDQQMLEGTGAGADLTGLRRLTGPATTVLGSGSGAVPTVDDLSKAITRMKTNNGRPGAWIMHPRTEGTIRILKDGDGNYIWSPAIHAAGPATLFGLPVLTSSQISIVENVGGANKSWIALVDPSQLVIGRRAAISVFYDPFSRSTYDQTLVRAVARFDFGLLNAGGVELITAVAAS